MYQKIEKFWGDHQITDLLSENQCHCLFTYYYIIQNLLKLKEILEETPFAPNQIDGKKYDLESGGDMERGMNWLTEYCFSLSVLDERDTVYQCQSQWEYICWDTGIHLVSSAPHTYTSRKCRCYVCCCVCCCVVLSIIICLSVYFG